jgi:hypothetical protein
MSEHPDPLDAISHHLPWESQIPPGFGMIDLFEMTALLVQELSEILHYGRLQQATATPDLSLVHSIVLRPPSGEAFCPLESGPE